MARDKGDMRLDPQHADPSPVQECTLAILQRYELDCEALHALFRLDATYRVVGASSTLRGLLRTCAQFKPDVALVDARYSTQRGDVVQHSEELVHQGNVRCVLFVDEMPNNLRAMQATRLGWAGYITRRSPFEHLMRALENLLNAQAGHGKSQEKSEKASKSTAAGASLNQSPLARLTPRELEIFHLLAQGMSARECANVLGVAASTVDNHKSRLMRKLKVTKSIQLTLLAVRENVISP